MLNTSNNPKKNFEWDPAELLNKENELKKESSKEESHGSLETITSAGDFVEGIEGADGMGESLDKKVAESSEKANENKSSSLGQKGYTPQQAELKAKLPKDEHRAKRIMREQIEKVLNREIKIIHKKIKKIDKKNDMAFEMNNLVMRLREVKNILAKLAHSTLELLESLWFKIVHGLV